MSTTPGTVASPSDLHVEITTRITEDGINPDCSHEEKLFYVWRLLQQTEVDLHQSLETEESLRKTQAEEMHEVESYVEHIRHLSDERELLIQELEGENEQLKLDNRELKQAMKGVHDSKASSSEQLMEQGLAEIASASVSEQIAFLLLERARMVHKGKVAVGSTNGVKVMPDSDISGSCGDHLAETPTVEEVLQEERERMRVAEEKMRVAHEEEINFLMDETDKLEEQLAHIRVQKEEIERDRERLQAELEKEMKQREKDSVATPVPRPASPARNNNDLTLRKIIADKTQLECELVALKARLRQLETDNTTLETDVKSLEQGRDVARTQKLSYESKYTKVKAKLHDVEQTNVVLEATYEGLKSENMELREQFENDKVKTETSSKETQDKLETLEGLTDSLQGEKSELMDMMHRLRQEKDVELQLSQTKLEEDLRRKDECISNQAKIYEDRLQELNEETCHLRGALDGVTSEKIKYEEDTRQKDEEITNLLRSHEEQMGGMEEKLRQLSAAKDSTSVEKGKLEVALNARQELLDEMEHYRCDLIAAERREEEILLEQKSLYANRDSLEQRYKQDTDGLKAKLQLSLQEFAKLCACLEQEKIERSNVEVKLKQADDTLHCQNQDSNTENETNLVKVSQLERRVEEMQDDMFLNQEELEKSHGQYEMMVKQLREEKTSSEEELQTRIEVLTSERDNITESELVRAARVNEIKSKDDAIKTLVDELSTSKTHNESLVTILSGERGRCETSAREIESLQKNHAESMDELRSVHQTEIGDFVREVEQLENFCKEREREIGERRGDHEDMETTMREQIVNLEEYCATVNHEKENIDEQSVLLFSQNRELKAKLESVTAEKRGRLNCTQEQLQQSQQEVSTAQERIMKLCEELQMKRQKITVLEREAVGMQAKHEGDTRRRQLEREEMRERLRREAAALRVTLGECQGEVERLRQARDQKQAVIEKCTSELQEARLSVKRLEGDIETEKQLRGELQGRNGSLDAEIQKVWRQVAALNDKITSLENTKRSLEVELERIIVPVSQSEKMFQAASLNAEFETRSWKSRYDVAEAKAERLQVELSEAIVKMQTAERLGYDDSHSNGGNRGDWLSMYDSATQKAFVDQSVSELQQQVSILGSREAQLCEQNRELQHRLIDTDCEMVQMRDRAQLAADIEAFNSDLDESQKAEANRRNMSEKIVRLQRELKTLHGELMASNDKRDMWEKRYDDRRMRTKSKLTKAREYYTDERNKLREQVLKLGEDLRVTRTSLSMEQQWKDKMDAIYRSLLDEKRLLLTQLSEQGEASRDQLRKLAILDSRSKYLEKENSQLQDKLDSHLHHKRPLVNKIFSLDHRNHWGLSSHEQNINSLTVTTSGLGNSMDSSWDQDRLSDAMATANVSPSSTVQTLVHADSEQSFEV